MSENVIGDHRCPGANEVLKKGLKRNEQDDECVKTEGEVNADAVQLEYRDDLSMDEAGVLRTLLGSKSFPAKKLKFWGTPLSIARTALENLEECSSLEELELLGVDCEGKEFSLNLCGIFGNLRTLNLACNDIGDSFAKGIADFLRGNDSLQELGLWSNDIGDEGATALAEALTVNITLKRLNLNQNNLTSQTLVAFADTLTVNSTLELVELSGLDTELEEIEILFEEERYVDVFRRIYIRWEQDCLPHLSRLIREDRHCSEVSVDIAASVPKDCLREFFDAVAGNTTVRTLQFAPNGETFDAFIDGLVSLLTCTATLSRVQSIMLLDRDESLVRVFNALKENHSVTSITVNVEVLTVDIATSLAELLANNSTLNDVNLYGHCKIESGVLDIILEALKKNYTLTNLGGFDAESDDEQEAVSEMEELLKRNSRLLDTAVEFVLAGGVDFTDDGEIPQILKKVIWSAGVFKKLEKVTGKQKEEVQEDVEAALSHI